MPTTYIYTRRWRQQRQQQQQLNSDRAIIITIIIIIISFVCLYENHWSVYARFYPLHALTILRFHAFSYSITQVDDVAHQVTEAERKQKQEQKNTHKIHVFFFLIL